MELVRKSRIEFQFFHFNIPILVSNRSKSQSFSSMIMELQFLYIFSYKKYLISGNSECLAQHLHLHVVLGKVPPSATSLYEMRLVQARGRIADQFRGRVEHFETF